jgi:hypothetical protein
VVTRALRIAAEKSTADGGCPRPGLRIGVNQRR